jgi:hypothetical protein
MDKPTKPPLFKIGDLVKVDECWIEPGAKSDLAIVKEMIEREKWMNRLYRLHFFDAEMRTKYHNHNNKWDPGNLEKVA